MIKFIRPTENTCRISNHDQFWAVDINYPNHTITVSRFDTEDSKPNRYAYNYGTLKEMKEIESNLINGYDDPQLWR
jgi:hypothetical protein